MEFDDERCGRQEVGGSGCWFPARNGFITPKHVEQYQTYMILRCTRISILLSFISTLAALHLHSGLRIAVQSR